MVTWKRRSEIHWCNGKITIIVVCFSSCHFFIKITSVLLPLRNKVAPDYLVVFSFFLSFILCLSFFLFFCLSSGVRRNWFHRLFIFYVCKWVTFCIFSIGVYFTTPAITLSAWLLTLSNDCRCVVVFLTNICHLFIILSISSKDTYCILYKPLPLTPPLTRS